MTSKHNMEGQNNFSDISLNCFDSTTIIQPSPSKDELRIEACGGLAGKFLADLRKKLINKVQERKSLYSNIYRTVGLAVVTVYIGLLIKQFVNTGYNLNWCFGYGKAFIYIVFTIWCTIYYMKLKKNISVPIRRLTKSKFYKNNILCLKYGIYLTILTAFVIFIVIDTASYRRRLVSLLGIVFFVAVSFIFSKHPEYIRWDIVLSGIVLQIVVGFTAIRWDTGSDILQCFGDNVVVFLDYGLEGARFVYGDFLLDSSVLAFAGFSTLYFLAMIAKMLFYLGWLQRFCFTVGGFIEMFLGTTIIESVNAVTIIFLGFSESPLLYSVYIVDLTSSELHAVMASGFSAVAGTLLAVYTSIGVNPRYIMTASVMAAPASLGFAKLLYPETVHTKTSSKNIKILKSDDTSLLQAAISGATSAIGMILGILASVISCISFIAFLNGVCSWLSHLVGYDGVTLEDLVGHLFVPIAWLMGVRPEECQYVGSLIGMKTIANELVAYIHLGNLKKLGKLSARSETIASFALCAFSNPGGLGSCIATLVTLEPLQKKKINKVALRAFFTGCITTFTSACIAGLLTEEEGVRLPQFNSTLSI